MDVFSSVSIAERSILRMLVRWKRTRLFKHYADSFQCVEVLRKYGRTMGRILRVAEKELSRSIRDLDDGTIKRELHRYGTDWYRCAVSEWHFQPPTASHMSGVWERLIRSVRKAIIGVLGDRGAFSGRETLRTVFAEVMSILNSRPLCPASDPNDMEALTPNHLLLQRRNLVVPPGVFTKEELYTRKQWRRAVSR